LLLFSPLSSPAGSELPELSCSIELTELSCSFVFLLLLAIHRSLADKVELPELFCSIELTELSCSFVFLLLLAIHRSLADKAEATGAALPVFEALPPPAGTADGAVAPGLPILD
jgi:hypothetical protein